MGNHISTIEILKHSENESIIRAVKYELDKGIGLNDTAAIDKISNLANLIENVGRNEPYLMSSYFPYWKARVSYLRHGDFPNPGIDRNKEEFRKVLEECITKMSAFYAIYNKRVYIASQIDRCLYLLGTLQDNNISISSFPGIIRETQKLLDDCTRLLSESNNN